MPRNLALENIQALHRALQSIGHDCLSKLAYTLDEVTRNHTAFSTFQELLSAPGGYFPSLPKAPEQYAKKEKVRVRESAMSKVITRETWYAELDFLALAYDMAQEARGDQRRAFRGFRE